MHTFIVIDSGALWGR